MWRKPYRRPIERIIQPVVIACRGEIMRCLLSWQLLSLLFVATAAGALDNSGQSTQSPSNPPADSAAPPSTSADTTPPATSTPSVTVTGKVAPLPKLAPDKFTDCYGVFSTSANLIGGTPDYTAAATCEAELARDTRIVIDKCVNRDGKSAPAVAIQACTELVDGAGWQPGSGSKLLEGHDRFYPFVNRAMAYYAEGDKAHALDDYNTAIQLAPKRATPYYYRGVFYAAQTDGAAALRDFETALSIDPKLVAALRQRAIVYLRQKNFSGALADFSEAVRLQPKIAQLWSERGYVYLLQRDYESALKDEAEAIRLDPKLARAYFLRGAAFGDLGNSTSAVGDLVTAVNLDPSLDHYVSTKGKTASIALPPL
jgi:Tfp pilus assembly protein PilF